MGVKVKPLARLVTAAALSVLVAGCATSTEAPVTELDKGLALLKEGEYEQARVHYSAMLARDPENPYVHLNLGAALDELGRKDEAASHYQQAIDLGKDKPVYLVVVERQEKLTNTDVVTVAQDNLAQLRGTQPSSKNVVAFE